MDIAILTEGNNQVGFGHITRCLALYDAFEEYGHKPTLIVDGDSTVFDLIKNKRYILFAWLANRKKTLQIIENSALIVIDSYGPDLSFYEDMSQESTHVYLDDYTRAEYPGGIVVNGNIASHRAYYLNKTGTAYLLGHRYIILRKTFWEIATRITKNAFDSILITFGGADTQNLTPKVLKALVSSFPEATKSVIISRGFNNVHDIESVADNNTSLIFNPADNEIKRAMQEADIAISAGGQTLNELARMGVPTIAIVVAKNQMSHVQAWNKVGFLDYVVWTHDDRFLDKVIHYVDILKDKSIRETRSKIGYSYIDGLGAKRVAQFCLASYINKKVNVRVALPKDITGVYELSNDADVRKNSLNAAPINFNDHVTWFGEKLRDRDSLFLVAELDNELIAQVRFDITNNVANTSLSVKRPFRGFGLGKPLFERALSCLKESRNEVNEVTAIVKAENTASIKLFKHLGFSYRKTTKIKNQNVLELFYDIKNISRRS